MKRAEILRISKQFADLMYQKEKSTILAQQSIERQKNSLRLPPLAS